MTALQKPKLSFWQIWNMSFGFLGIQFGFALQNGNASRILQTYGADVEHLSWFWLAAPLTGMIVQPIIGYYSDRTWNRLGRRRPYFLAGALLSAFALVLMPNSALLATLLPPMLIGAGLLMLMDASFNVAMEPFRALVADNLPDSQRSRGFSIQTFLIGIGAVIGSWLPYIFAEYFGVSKVAEPGQVPDNVIFSFYVGAVILAGTIIWTVIRTKEYSPEEYEKFHADEPKDEDKGIFAIFSDFSNMPRTMKQLGLVQFFSWFALFSMWVFTTPAVAQHIYHVAPGDTSSENFANAGNWVGILFGVYNGVSAIYALLLPSIARATSRKIAHAFSLVCGGVGLLSIYFIQDPNMLIFSMVGIGLAWGSILAMPYAILSSSIPARKMGVYMGIFNFFITFPQIVNGIFGGPIVKNFYNGEAIYAIVLAGLFMICGAISVLYVQDNKDIKFKSQSVKMSMNKSIQLSFINKALVFFALVLSLAATSCKKSDGSDSGSGTSGGGGGSTTDETETGLVLVSPNFPTDNQEMTITFDASRGNSALATHSGDVFIYIGVITDKSTSPTSWRYLKSPSFTTAVSELKMSPLGAGKYKFTFTPRSFLGVPNDEKILKIAMLFRSADGSLVARNVDGTDIYTPIYESGTLQLKFVLPEFLPTYIPKPSISVDVGGQVFVKGLSSRNANLALSLNGQSFATATNATSIKGTAKITANGIQKIKIAATENGNTTEQTFEFIVNGTPNVQALPLLATKDGVNILGGTSAILNLYAPNKSSVYVIGDFNNWQLDNAYALKRTPDGTRWWIQLENLNPQAEYAYQYVIDGEIRVADPYTEKVLDPSDSFITSSVYPNLKAYPAGKTTGIVSTFSTTQTNYNWQITNFNRPAKSDLVVYEMLIRDFVSEHSYAAALDKLDYLKNLGINAIELMPVNEFEGNSSWGYNTNFYFAPDKYYGTKNALKNFIDECHKKGIAVILDVVLNHSFGSSPMVQMYYDKFNNRPSSTNPWYNSTDRHPFGVGFDFNHESAATKAFAKNVMRFWMQEYKVDGYRFDLSKGFTQNFTNDVGAWSNYDASRIAIWKEYNAYMKALDSDFYVILEHFAADAEEKELAADGMLLWNNVHGSYGEATMGWLANSNFSRSFYDLHGFTSTSADKLVTYMESHDEERILYKNLQFGNTSGSYSTKSLNTALKRKEMAAAFLFASPGPKMIWQFGELGYDVNIDNNGRTGEKPIRWNYFTVAERKALYDAMSKMIRLKTGNSVFRTTNYSYSLTGAVKYIRLVGANMSVVVVGNFDVNAQSANFSFPASGTWYDYMNPGQNISINGNYTETLLPGEYHIYTSVNLN